MPLVSQTFDQLIDFTRTTAGTFVGSNGLIQNTPASRNLLTFTQEFDNAAWTKNRATVTANATTAPDGTLTADKLVEDNTASNNHRTFQGAVTTGQAYAFSVFAKASERNWMYLRVARTGPTTPSAWFDLSAGTVGTVGTGLTASIQAFENGWYRCQIVVDTAAAVLNSLLIGLATGDNVVNYTGDNTSGIFLWGAQLEVGSTATDYTRNAGGVFPPRFDYDPVTLAPRGLLIEEQRTNLLLRSEEFDNNVAWTLVNANVSADAETAPDGGTTADKLEETAVTGQFQARQSGPSLTTFTFSVYAKAAERNLVYIQFVATSNEVIFFNLTNGTVAGSDFPNTTNTASRSSSITAAGNGWYRCSISITLVSAATPSLRVGVANSTATTSYAGTAGSGIYVWGAQLETGDFATSYIPTVASQVTRTADQATITGQNFSQWYNQSEGTFVAEATIPADRDGTSGNYYFDASDGTLANAVRVVDVNGTRAQIFTGGVTQFNNTVGAEPTTTVKFALAFAANDAILCVGGVLGTADTSVTLPVVNALAIGVRGDFSNNTQANGHIRRITYFPARLSNAQLQALTS
jgi:hypothetical protein